MIALELVEEAFLAHPLAVFRRDLDVRRRQEEHHLLDPLDSAIESVSEPAHKVDQALCELAVDALQVNDHGRVVLELRPDLLGVVEALGFDDVNPRGCLGDRLKYPLGASPAGYPVRDL